MGQTLSAFHISLPIILFRCIPSDAYLLVIGVADGNVTVRNLIKTERKNSLRMARKWNKYAERVFGSPHELWKLFS